MTREEAEKRVMAVVSAAITLHISNDDFNNPSYNQYFSEQKELLLNALCGEHSEGKPANGKSPFAEMQGKWPGDETAEELLAALKEPPVIQGAVKGGVSFEFYAPEATDWKTIPNAEFMTVSLKPHPGFKKFRAVEVEP